uniref:cupin-like domain-containing protein n=1 Tax=Ningiella ruwaisensis TaxID=2364274 RepID=UPI00109F25F1|nr:cupin-like domain-containing protein [Ningiella ruwaisensis]
MIGLHHHNLLAKERTAVLKSLKEISLSSINELSIEMLTQTEPFVMRGLVNDWPIVQCANNHEKAELLLKMSANKAVPAWVAPAQEKGRFFYDKDMKGFNFAQKNLFFNDVLNWLIDNQAETDKATLYLGSTSIDYILPSYREQHDIPCLNHAPLVSLWMGNRSRVAAHFDATDNVACVLAGERTFTLFAPDQWDNLYVGPIEFNPAGQAISLVDFDNPDFKRFPKFKHALENGYEVRLKPGDGIFIPSMWWHSVKAHGAFNLLQNYWWRQAPEEAANPTDALVHALLGIKALPKAQREAWKAIFDKLVFDAESAEHIPEHARGFLGDLDEKQARRMRQLLKRQLD